MDRRRRDIQSPGNRQDSLLSKEAAERRRALLDLADRVDAARRDERAERDSAARRSDCACPTDAGGGRRPHRRRVGPAD